MSHSLTGFVRLGRFGIPVGFALIAAPVFLAVGFLVLRAEQDTATNALVRATEVQNAGIARTLANAHAEPISYLLAFDIGDAPELLPIGLRRSGLTPLIEASIRDTNVVDVRLYDKAGITLFSLDQSQLGQDISACECFREVMQDGTYSELIHVGPEGHLHENSPHSHGSTEFDHLSTMLRLNVLTPHLVATESVLELRSDVTGLVAPIIAAQRETRMEVGIPLVALYILMVALVTFGHATVVRRDRQAAMFAARAAQSEASDRAKSEFLSLMSHELRTPLNAIVGFSQLISDYSRNRSDEEAVGWADAVHDSGLHMTRVVSSILDITALELGEFELDREILCLPDIVDAAAKAVQPAFDTGLVTLTVQHDGHRKAVHGDAQKLCEVFENLLSNAARFTPAGGTVDVTLDSNRDGFVSVKIRDTGAGMTKTQIEQARLPFQTNWSGLSREADGAGLGLTIADRVVKLLGGSLGIESVEHEGTLVTVSLPVIRPDNANDAEVDPIPLHRLDNPKTADPAGDLFGRKIVA
ncbi:MAG: HAMP domain-containing sensor histidine kinase [Alphaproteobacteria bacterium]